MSKNKLLQDLTIEEAITRYGQLNIDKSDIPLLLAEKLNREERTELLKKLSDPTSDESELYQIGVAKGKEIFAQNVENNLKNPKVIYAYRDKKAYDREVEINKKIAENFGIGVED